MWQRLQELPPENQDDGTDDVSEDMQFISDKPIR